jgi:hypothetical protein
MKFKAGDTVLFKGHWNFPSFHRPIFSYSYHLKRIAAILGDPQNF